MPCEPLRRLRAPVILMLSVGLGFAATLGAATLLFQHTMDNPGVNFMLPLVLFLFVVALGTDYNILISDRIREEMAHPGPPWAAHRRGRRVDGEPALRSRGGLGHRPRRARRWKRRVGPLADPVPAIRP
ncbi:MMPL family transporter [Kitasatospora sp. NPDC094011]|uniref:MMPL family transporter n=1 Tax=Kitasatospora sp. NPDC094011 TaxID=3364090 RepID=UPI0038189DDD